MGAFRIPGEHRRELLKRFSGSGVCLAIFRFAVHDGVVAGEPELRIAPIAVDIADRPGELPPDLADQLMGLLPSAEAVSGPPMVPESALAAALDAAPGFAERRRLDVIDMQRISRRSRVAQQRATIERTFGAKIEAAERRAAAATEERIKRMQQGRLRNLRGERDDNLAELRAAREPTAEMQMIAATVFTAA